MKEYKRLDTDRPFTLAEVLHITDKYFKRSKTLKILGELVAKYPNLKEEALLMKKVISFYPRRIILAMAVYDANFKKARADFDAEQKKHTPQEKLLRAIFGDKS